MSKRSINIPNLNPFDGFVRAALFSFQSIATLVCIFFSFSREVLAEFQVTSTVTRSLLTSLAESSRDSKSTTSFRLKVPETYTSTMPGTALHQVEIALRYYELFSDNFGRAVTTKDGSNQYSANSGDVKFFKGDVYGVLLNGMRATERLGTARIVVFSEQDSIALNGTLLLHPQGRIEDNFEFQPVAASDNGLILRSFRPDFTGPDKSSGLNLACDVDANMAGSSLLPNNSPQAAFGGPVARELEIAAEAACSLVEASGSEENAFQHVILAINRVAAIYEVELNLVVRLSFFHAWADCAAPNYPYSEDVASLLTEFTDYWRVNFATQPYDVAMLYFNKPPNFSGGTVGRAWLGGACGQSRYGFTMVLSIPDPSITGFISAHELGHSLNAVHDPQPCVPPFIMCPAGGFIEEFSELSELAIANFVSQANCLAPLAQIPNGPSFNDVVPPVVNEGESVNFLVEARDSNGLPLTVQALTLPQNASFSDGQFSMLTSESTVNCSEESLFFARFMAVDSENRVTELSVPIRILNVGGPPEIAVNEYWNIGLSQGGAFEIPLPEVDSEFNPITYQIQGHEIFSLLSNPPRLNAYFYTPGEYEVDLIVQNCIGMTVSRHITVRAFANLDAPQIQPIPFLAVYEGEVVRIPLRAMLPPGLEQNQIGFRILNPQQYPSLRIDGSELIFAPDFLSVSWCGAGQAPMSTIGFGLAAYNSISGAQSEIGASLAIIDLPMSPELAPISPASLLEYTPGKFFSLFLGPLNRPLRQVSFRLGTPVPSGLVLTDSTDFNFARLLWLVPSDVHGTVEIPIVITDCNGVESITSVRLVERSDSAQTERAPLFRLTGGINKKGKAIFRAKVLDPISLTPINNSDQNCFVDLFVSGDRNQLLQENMTRFPLVDGVGRAQSTKVPMIKSRRKNSLPSTIFYSGILSCDTWELASKINKLKIQSQVRPALNLERWITKLANSFPE